MLGLMDGALGIQIVCVESTAIYFWDVLPGIHGNLSLSEPRNYPRDTSIDSPSHMPAYYENFQRAKTIECGVII